MSYRALCTLLAHSARAPIDTYLYFPCSGVAICDRNHDKQNFIKSRARGTYTH